MSRMQVVAKSALSAMGVIFALKLFSYAGNTYTPVLKREPLLYVAIYIGAAVVVFRLFVLANDHLARRIAGREQPLPQNQLRRWMTVSMTVAALFTGSLLLTRSGEHVAKLLLAVVDLRDFFNQIVWGENPFDEVGAEAAVNFCYSIIHLAAVIYLLTGARGFVRRQTRAALAENDKSPQSVLEPDNE